MDPNEVQFFPPWRFVAEFADGARILFDGLTEEQARRAMEAAQETHGDIFWYDGVTDENYTDGQYHKLVPRPPMITFIDLEDYDGPLDENGLPPDLTTP